MDDDDKALRLRLAGALLCDEYLGTADAADELGIPTRELVNLRKRGKGPAGCKAGASLYCYRLSDLLAWQLSEKVDRNRTVPASPKKSLDATF